MTKYTIFHIRESEKRKFIVFINSETYPKDEVANIRQNGRMQWSLKPYAFMPNLKR